MILLGLLVFASAMCIDLANTNYVLAVNEGNGHKAGLWSVMQWVSGLTGFLIAVKITMWLLPAEAAGLYAGTRLSMFLAGRKVK